MVREGDGYPPYEMEEITATSVSAARYRIDGIPLFVHAPSRTDVVTAVRVAGDGERLLAENVVEQPDHWTVRVEPKNEAEMGQSWRWFRQDSRTGRSSL